MRDIGDVDAQPPARSRPLDIDRIIEILRVVGIDRENEFSALLIFD